MIGETILHYEILEKIGEGAMGVVYKARDIKLERTVALKFLTSQFSGAVEEERERFKTEAKAAAALNHPNIAAIYAIEELDEKIFIVMEYVQGRELREIIQIPPVPPLEKGGTSSHRGGLPIANAINYAIQIAEGLRAAHEKGVIHRDIKSSNIMVTGQGEVKITDFGLAKMTGGTQVTKTSTSLGTPSYMSPEQARGEKLDSRTDIWSLGVVMYEMACGHLPFDGDYEMAVAYSIINEEPKRLRQWRPEISERFESVVMRALAKDRDERHENATELIADLNSFESRRTGAPKPRSRRKAGTTFSRRTLLLLATALVALLIITVFFVFRQQTGTTVSTSIAVMPFEFEGEEDWSWLGGAITELLNTNLAQYEALRVLDARERTRIMASVGIRGKSISVDQGLQIARHAKAGNVVLGSLQKIGDALQVQAQIYETDNGSLLADLNPFEGDHSKVYEAADNLSAQLTKLLNIGADSGGSVAKLTTSSLDAFRYFVEGKNAAFDRRH